ncbi:D-alanine--D-alanine ligase [Parabacteroides sp. PF5-9]|uniref:D-alanine--D-alanine ligase n=1 Tax=Parabacteroides sp. PF5-9 TaxID=1742404 RepID=UPI002475E4F1|nr:D-alanine--D-alanine ligase [Parabacteroides sp. PF5-9]MDH6357966.1 D-alanine-D-alanine ligase [Parabacteroides sp. PF5-9]
MKKNIAIIAGGDSSEIVVSLKSAEGLYSFIDKEKYNVYIALVKKDEWVVKLAENEYSLIDKNDFSFLQNGKKVQVDFAYITIHGTPGEDGRLQGYFDLIGLPYSSCSLLTSAITFNKFVCNNYLKNFGVRVADSIRLFAGEQMTEEAIVQRLGLPVFIKPNDGGSSFGVTKVKTESQIRPAIAKAFAEGKEVIIEKYMEGTEVTCGCYKTKKGKEVVFPLTEVVTENEFFDFDAKYNGQSDEITPARLPEALTKKIQQQTSRIYDLLGAKGLIRVDYIILADNEPYMLEVNTVPGMTVASFIPQQVRAAGLDIQEVMSDLIENELN